MAEQPGLLWVTIPEGPRVAHESKLAPCPLFGLQVFKFFSLVANKLKIKIFYIKI